MDRKKVIIWGAGQRGKRAVEFLEQSRVYKIVGVGDNNVTRWKENFCGYKIINCDELKGLIDVDLIVVASGYFQEIKEKLVHYTDVDIINGVEEIAFTRISIDISGMCNAKCKWCVTGRANRENRKGIRPGLYMSMKTFSDLYNHLYSSKIIEKSTEIMLYSWGEPLLNKEYIDIISFLDKQRQKFSVSTNASVVRMAEDDIYKYCCSFVYSMPGFSQESYDRIHNFNFEMIKDNICRIHENIRSCGFVGEESISYHIYRFNDDEVSCARGFADDLGIVFNPYYPYFNGNSMAEKYLEKKMVETEITEAKSELYLEHVPQLLSQRPAGFQCFLRNILSFDFQGKLVLCCAADPGVSDYYFGNASDFKSYSEIRKKRLEMLSCSTCNKCRALALDYWMENNPSYSL